MRDHVDPAMRLAVLGVAVVVQFVLCTRTLLSYQHQPMALAVAAFVAFGVVTAGCAVWVLRRAPLPGPVVVAGTVLVLAAAAAGGAALPPDGHLGAPDWVFGLAGWPLVLLLLDRVPVLLAAFAVHLAVGLGQFLLLGTPDRARIGSAAIIVFGTVTFQLAVVVFTGVLRHSIDQVVVAAAERDRQASRAAVAEQAERGQRALFAGQLGGVLPLLADLADGRRDPCEPETRRRCALAATQLRRLFAENDQVPDPLLHEITACVEVAERRGLDVALAVSGAAVAVPPEVRRELTGPVAAALAAARVRARVSVLRTGDQVRVAVLSDVPGTDEPTGAVSPSPAGVQVERETRAEHVRMEARWRSS